MNAFKKRSQPGRRRQIYAVYTQKCDVTRRLEHILGNKGIDIPMAMAHELVTEKGIGERADSVWAALQKKQDEVFAVKSSDTKDSMPKAIAEIPTSENAIAPDPWPPIRTPVETIP